MTDEQRNRRRTAQRLQAWLDGVLHGARHARVLALVGARGARLRAREASLLLSP